MPRGAKKKADGILKRGTATGHAHVLEGGQVLEHDGKTYARIKTPGAVVHEEHNRVELPAGTYEVRPKREYVPSAPPREVWD